MQSVQVAFLKQDDLRPKGGEQHQQQQQSDKENGQCPDARQLFRREQHHAEEQLDAQRKAEYDAGQEGGFPVLAHGFAVILPPAAGCIPVAAEQRIHHAGDGRPHQQSAHHADRDQHQKTGRKQGVPHPQPIGDAQTQGDKIRKEKAFPVAFQKLLITGQTLSALAVDDGVTRKKQSHGKPSFNKYSCSENRSGLSAHRRCSSPDRKAPTLWHWCPSVQRRQRQRHRGCSCPDRQTE